MRGLPTVPVSSATSELLVTIVTARAPAQAQQRLWAPIAQCWPHGAPHADVGITSFERAADREQPLRGDVALIDASDDPECDAGVLRALDRLAEEFVPAVVLVGDSASERLAVYDNDVLILRRDAPSASIAMALWTLSHRQTVVRRLDRELQMSNRFQGGLRGEIDRIHEELQLAATVQREFLPRVIPSIDHIDVEVLFRPCGYVSGDIYDVQKLDDHHLSVFIADAVGHGVPAALMTMVLCRCLATGLAEAGRDQEILSPGEVLGRMNQELIRRHSDTPRFATAVYGIIDERTREVRLAGAGHPHPLVFNREGRVRRVPTEGGLLGIFPEDTFEEVQTVLEPDEMLVLHSDGFETAFPSRDADEYGRRIPNQRYVGRFGQLARTWWGEGLPAAMNALTEGIDCQSGSLHQIDDLTAIMIVPTVDTLLAHALASAEQAAMEAERRQTG